MGYCVIMLDGKFMEWTSVSDSPRSPLLTEEQFITYWRKEYGWNRMWDLPKILSDVKRKGTSALGHTVDEILRDNRAGKNEEKLSRKEIIAAFSCTPEEFLSWCQEKEMYAQGEFSKRTKEVAEWVKEEESQKEKKRS